jgi:NADPH-dependent ferric siderophore reductase
MSANTTTESEDSVAVTASSILDHINGQHDDAILFIARVLGDRPEATSAVARSLDINGMSLQVDADQVLRFEFAEPATGVDDLGLRLMTLVARARELAPDAPLTSIEDQRAEIDAIKTFFTTVRRVEQRSPGLRRITFGGGDLDTLTWLSPDQFFYLLLPPRGSTEMSIDHSFTWEQVRDLPDEMQPRGAYYTLRHHRPDVYEVDIDVVLHGDESEASASASAWAVRAQPGDVAALWGPRTSWEPPAGTDRYLLVADETGLPATAAILEHLPHDATVLVVVEVADAGERQPLLVGPNVQVTWLHRDGASAGTTGQLAQTVRSMTTSGQWPRGQVYAWGGGESHEMTEVRTHLRTEVGLARDQVSMVGYWRLEAPH